MDCIAFIIGIVYILMGLITVLHAKVLSLALNKSRDHAAMTSHTTTVTMEPHTECLFMGNLDISLHLHLNNTSFNEKYNKYSTILHTPVGGSIPANCSAGRAEVVLISADGRVGVSIVFEEQNETESDTPSWAVTKLALVTKDDVSSDVTKDALTKRGFERTPGLLMFQTPYNKTIVCDANQRVVFHSDRAHASLVFSHVNMQPPRTSRGQWGKLKGFTCPEPVHDASAEARTAQIFVPVILSVSLAVVVSLLVIGYLIHRKIEGMGYTSME